MMKGRLVTRAAMIVVLVLTQVFAGLGTAGAQATGDYAPGRILVKFQPGASGQAIAEAHRRNGGRVKAIIPGIDVQVVEVPVGQEERRAAAYGQNPSVEFAEVDGIYRADADPADPLVAQQWQYNNTGQTGGTIDADIDAFEAWDVVTGSASIGIAILDTGIDLDHPDLAGKVVQNANFTASDTVDDRYGHGTHVAGTAAALTGNGIGVAGTCPNCALYNVKVLGDDGGGYWSWIAGGIRWSADNGAHVVSMSLGGSVGSRSLQLAIDYAWGKGAILTCAAGNSGSKVKHYPAAYTKCIAVAATDHKDAKAGFSNWGKDWVDVAAPGVAILSTAPNDPNTIWGDGVSYGTISGTSMATPHVAGVAGLVWSSGRCDTATSKNTCVRSRIEQRADRIAGTGTYWAYGRINANRSVTQ
ncbi:MAG: S8 family serine peptidase [Chloroflexi bacterium]|nr:S8 family serine peptidase [Chloroflexota bacterium]